MFDVGFSEMLVILIVALVVLGPDRLPQVARTLGKTWGQLQRYVNRIKQDINSSMELAELREVEHRLKAESEAMERSLTQTSNDISLSVHQLEYELEHAGQNGSSGQLANSRATDPK